MRFGLGGSTCRAAIVAAPLVAWILLPGISHAEATVEKIEGHATIMAPDGREIPASRRQVILDGSSITTDDDSKVAIRSDRGIYVLGANSSMKIERPSFLKQLFGKIYYAIRRFRDRDQEEVKVQTLTATIGIRGTEFLVSAEQERESIAMTQGQVEIDSNQSGFKLYKSKTVSEFEDYKRQFENGVKQMQEEFEAYKRAEQREFIGYVRSLQLAKGQSVTISGDEAVAGEVDEAQKRTIDELTEFAGEILELNNPTD